MGYRVTNRKMPDLAEIFIELDKIHRLGHNTPMAKILTIHGPNLNLLGMREPTYYGNHRLEDINNLLIAQANELGHLITCFQSNAEHEIISRIHHTLHEGIDIILINPAAYTHTSIAIRDALLAVQIPFIEIHMSNVHKREDFRRYSYFSDIAIGSITGFGAQSYVLALQAANHYLSQSTIIKESSWTPEKSKN